MNCSMCKISLPESQYSNGKTNYRYDMDRGWVCENCVQLKVKELENVQLSMVSSCPDCGAPIYGMKEVPYIEKPNFLFLTSGSHCYGNSSTKYSCGCRHIHKATKNQIDNLTIQFEKLNQKLDSIEKVQIINSGIQQPKWFEFWRK